MTLVGALLQYLLDSSSGCKELCSMCGRLDHGLLLREPVDGIAIDEVWDTCNCSACGKAMVWVGILVRRGG